MEDRRTDAEIARDNCLGAMLESTDDTTRRSLWRAALRYNERMRAEATGENAPALARPLAPQPGRANGVG